MGAFTTEMQTLVHGIRASAKERSAALAGLKKTTARVLADARGLVGDIGKSRRDMGRRLARQLRGAAGALRKSVSALLSDFSLVQKRANVLGFLAADRNGRSAAVEAMMNEVGRERADRATQLGTTLKAFMDRIQGEVSQFLGAAHESRRAGFESTQERVFAALSAIRERVAAIGQDAQEFVERSMTARGRMGHEVREALSLGRTARQEKLGALLAAFDETQQRIAADLRAAAELWHGLGLPPAAPAQPKARPRTSLKSKTTTRPHRAGAKGRPNRNS